MDYVISDLHLGHENIIKYENRPFRDAEQMDEILINNWNNAVTESDTVYYLGDLTFGRLTEKDRLKASALSKNQQQLERMRRYADALNGHIIWVKGNHLDPKGAILSVRKEVDGIEFDMIHNPDRANEIGFWRTKNRWLIHGHTHNKYPDKFPFIDPDRHWVNACIEVINYKPLSLIRLAELCKQGERLGLLPI